MSDNLTCEYCKKIFSAQSSLKKHKLTAKSCLALRPEDSQFSKNYKCDHCEYTTKVKHHLSQHVSTCKHKVTSKQNEEHDFRIKILLLEKELELVKQQRDEYKEQARSKHNNGKRESIPKAIKSQLWERVFGEAFSGKCQLCSEQFKVISSLWHASHIISHAQGGSDNIENLTILCASCNLSMGTMSFPEYKSKYQSQNNSASEADISSSNS